MTFYKKIGISAHNKQVMRFLVIGIILWPTPLPGLLLFTFPSLFLFDFKFKRGFDSWFWNKTRLGNFFYKNTMHIFTFFDKNLAAYLGHLISETKKKTLCSKVKIKILIPILHFIQREANNYKELFTAVQEKK